MSTFPKYMAGDKAFHGLDMQKDYDSYVCINHAMRKLVLMNKMQMYMDNGVNSEIKFVPLGPDMLIDATKTTTITYMVMVSRSVEVPIITPGQTITTEIDVKVVDTPEVKKGTWKSTNTGTPAVSVDSLINSSAFSPSNNGSLDTGATISWGAQVFASNISAWDKNCLNGAVGGYGNYGTVSKTADFTWTVRIGFRAVSQDEFYCGRTLGFVGTVPPGAHGDDATFRDGTFYIGSAPVYSGVITVEYKPEVFHMEKKTVTTTTPGTTAWETQTETTWEPRSEQIPQILPINSTSPDYWNYPISSFNLVNDKILSFLVYIEAGDGASGKFLVGYNSEPNIVMGAVTIGEGSDGVGLNDTKKGYLIEVPVPDNLERITFKYLKSEYHPEKAFATVLGYYTASDLTKLRGMFDYVPPSLSGGFYTGWAMNEMSTVDVTGGYMVCDTAPTTSDYGFTKTMYTFAIPADAEKGGKIYLTADLYTERGGSNGFWQSVKYRLEPTYKSNFSIYKVKFSENNISYNRWIVTATKYGVGGTMYSGIKNMKVYVVANGVNVTL